jgi:hypothetical protein
LLPSSDATCCSTPPSTLVPPRIAGGSGGRRGKREPAAAAPSTRAFHQSPPRAPNPRGGVVVVRCIKRTNSTSCSGADGGREGRATPCCRQWPELSGGASPGGVGFKGRSRARESAGRHTGPASKPAKAGFSKSAKAGCLSHHTNIRPYNGAMQKA